VANECRNAWHVARFVTPLRRSAAASRSCSRRTRAKNCEVLLERRRDRVRPHGHAVPAALPRAHRDRALGEAGTRRGFFARTTPPTHPTGAAGTSR